RCSGQRDSTKSHGSGFSTRARHPPPAMGTIIGQARFRRRQPRAGELIRPPRVFTAGAAVQVDGPVWSIKYKSSELLVLVETWSDTGPVPGGRATVVVIDAIEVCAPLRAGLRRHAPQWF